MRGALGLGDHELTTDELEARTRCFSRAEYARLIDLGVFQPGEPIELAITRMLAAP